jgi:subtilase family serine protease
MFPGTRLIRLFAAGAVIVSGIAATIGLGIAGVGATSYLPIAGQTLPAVVATAQRLSPEPTGKILDIAVGLNPRSETQLVAAIQAMYTPGSPTYKHYLTPAQFTARFAPTVAEYNAVLSYLRRAGLTITGTWPNRMLVEASGSIAQIDRAFHVTISDYRDTYTGMIFYANDRVPSVPASLASLISGVAGLTNLDQRHPMFVRQFARAHTPNLLPTPYTPQQMERGYNATPLILDGQGGNGQTTSILAEGNFAKHGPSDLAQFENTYHLPHVPVTIIGSSNDNSLNLIEPAIDTQWSTSMAPNLASLRIYIAKNLLNSSFVEMENTWVNDPNAGAVASESYGECETIDPTIKLENHIFMQAALEGRSVFISAGDQDAPECGTAPNVQPGDSAMASSPWVTAASGTTLVLNSNGTYAGETVWNGVCGGGAPCGTGGAPSLVFPEPSYQKGISIIDQTGMRGVGDLAADADPNSGVDVVFDGHLIGQFGGTSLSAPLLNGMFSDINSALAVNSKPAVGFANPALYEIGESRLAGLAYHDVTVGNNYYPGTSSPGDGYFAGAGWDFPSGWGSPNTARLALLFINK